MKIEIGYTRSSRAQICRNCGKTIPAGEQSIKYTRKLRGRVSLTQTWYVCLTCEEGQRK